MLNMKAINVDDHMEVVMDVDNVQLEMKKDGKRTDYWGRKNVLKYETVFNIKIHIWLYIFLNGKGLVK